MKTFCLYFAGFAVLSTTLIVATATTGQAHAQSFPSCTEQHYDADGDGFGWQHNATCIVDASTNPPPTYTNKSTGAPVELIRPYWDGNADIANRTIQCERFDYQPIDRTYQRGSDFFGIPGTVTIKHDSIVSSETSISEFIEDGDHVGWYSLQLSSDLNNPVTTFNPPFWTVEDGLYSSQELLTSPYIELVKTQANHDAIRIWFDEGDSFSTGHPFGGGDTHMTEGYFQCSDANAANLTPTGTFGEAGAPPVPAPSVTSVFTVQPFFDVASSDIFNRETGALVPLTKAHWDYNKDLAGRSIRCEFYSYQEAGSALNPGDSGQYIHTRSTRSDTDYQMSWMFPGSESSFEYWSFFEGVVRNYSVTINNGATLGNSNSPIFFRSDSVELIDNNSLRIWDASGSTYDQCDVQPSGPATSEESGVSVSADDIDVSANQTGTIAPPVNDADTVSSEDSTSNDDSNSPETTTSTLETSNLIDDNVNADQGSSVAQPVTNTDTASSGGGTIGLWVLAMLFGMAQVARFGGINTANEKHDVPPVVK